MQIWQYNAWCAGYKAHNVDVLSIQIQAAYYNAYWNGAQKHKKSLKSVIKSIYKELEKEKPKKLIPIDVDAISKEFDRLEEFRKYGWYKE